MWKVRGAFVAFLLLQCALAIWPGLGSALAQGRYDDPMTAEGWAWTQLERSEIADFNKRCHTPRSTPRTKMMRAGATTAASSPATFCKTC